MLLADAIGKTFRNPRIILLGKLKMLHLRTPILRTALKILILDCCSFLIFQNQKNKRDFI